MKIIKMHGHKNKYLFVGVFVSVLTGILIILIFFTYPKPPETSILNCQKMLGQINTVQAEVYAPKFYNTVQDLWKEIMGEWRKQNKKWFWQRDFSEVNRLTAALTETGDIAIRKSHEKKDSLRSVLKLKIALIEQEMDSFKTEFAHWPFYKPVINQFMKGELLFIEGKNAFDRRDYLLAERKIKESENYIVESRNKVGQRLQRYLEQGQVWKKWIKDTIEWSGQNNNNIILVDKLDRKLMIYRDGKLFKEFFVEFGPNWVGDKRKKGDKATPEGKYFIVEKLGIGKSKYHKALLINYPNKDDLEKFQESKRQGLMGKYIQIGGNIEIHGEGGKGFYWTDGCIALENRDMDILYDQVKIGTPVTIVGSIKI